MISCTFENGPQVYLRHAVVDAIIIKDEKILLVRRSADSYAFPSKLALAGGYVDIGETVEQAVLREVLEETGYRAKIKKFIKYIDDPNREERQNITFLFLLDILEKVGEPDDEISETIWVPLNNLPKKDEMAFDHLEIINDYINSKS